MYIKVRAATVSTHWHLAFLVQTHVGVASDPRQQLLVQLRQQSYVLLIICLHLSPRLGLTSHALRPQYKPFMLFFSTEAEHTAHVV